MFIARHPLDFRASLFNVRTIRRAIYKDGCVVLRHFIAEEHVRFFASLIERSFDRVDELLCSIGLDRSQPSESVTDHRFRYLVENIRNGQMIPWWFGAMNDGKSLYDLIRANRRARWMLERILGESWDVGPSLIRRVAPRGHGSGDSWAGPIDMHCDAPLLSRQSFSLNFWIPMDDCGRDAPGLKLAPGPFAPLQEEVRHDPAMSYVDMAQVEKQNARYASGLDGRGRFVPELKCGDAVVFHNWVMHGTHFQPTMSRRRVSVELRYNARTPAQFHALGC